MAELDSLLGCKISLISHQDIRYDGTLFSINQAESSIVLKDVKSFGTEDRITDKSKAILPSPASIPFVTFPGQEIKDLYVHETAAAPAAPPAPEQKPKQDNKPKHNKTEHTAPPAAPAHEKETRAPKTQNKERDNHHKEAAKEKPAPAAAPVAASTAASAAAGGAHSGVGTGSHLLKLREKKSGDATVDKVDAHSEFDFQESLKGFNKSEVVSEVNDSTNKYVKDDFFDNFTTGQTEDGKKTRMTASEERSLNQDTFGAIALTNQYRRGGRGRGGRGGGRGGGRSSGRGGNNNGRGRGGGRQSNTSNATNATKA